MSASLPQSHHDYTFADYLALERDSEIRHEFDAGEILALSGGTTRHSALAARMIVALGNTCAPGCTVFTSDMRVRVVAERGPFDMVNGYNTLTLTPAVDLRAGDFLAIVQTRGDPCGGMAVNSAQSEAMMFQFQSDLASGSFSSGDLRRNFEFGARASAGVGVLSNVIPVAGSSRGAFGSNFKTSTS